MSRGDRRRRVDTVTETEGLTDRRLEGTEPGCHWGTGQDGPIPSAPGETTGPDRESPSSPRAWTIREFRRRKDTFRV